MQHAYLVAQSGLFSGWHAALVHLGDLLSLLPCSVVQLVSGEKGTAIVGNKLKQLLETDEYAKAGGDYADVVYDMDMVQEEPKPAQTAAVPTPAQGKKAAADAAEQQQPATKRSRRK